MIICQIILYFFFLTEGLARIHNAKDRCPINEFRCTNEKCIPSVFKCDDNDDCGDQSDEIACPQHSFICGDGRIFNKISMCDGVKDCDNDEDIDECRRHKCQPSEIMCLTVETNRYGCIGEEKMCDSLLDCKDGSDETFEVCVKMGKKKEATCSSISPFRCADKSLCLPKRFTCDGFFDCDDKSDEFNCTNTAKKDTTVSEVTTKSTTLTTVDPCPGEFYCGPGHSEPCIPNIYKCDLAYDCAISHLDEKNCKDYKCPAHVSKKCETVNECISPKMYCDGNKDCSDGSDEAKCVFPKLKVVCDKHTQFQCHKLGKCIPRSYVCDNFDDCGDDSDERPNGDKYNCVKGKNLCKNNGSCEHFCANFYSEARCYCKPGFKISPENSSKCIDIDECIDQGDVGSSKCAHKCINKPGSYSCQCYEGFLKDPNNSHLCVAAGEQFLLYAANHGIRELRLTHSQLSELLNDSALPNSQVIAIDLDIDYSRRLVFWSEPSPIPRINVFDMKLSRNKILLEGSPNKFTNNTLKFPVGLSYDWINEILFYTDNELKEVGVLNVTNHARKVIHKFDKNVNLRSIVVHPLFRKVYLVNWGKSPSILSMNYDGQNLKKIVTEGINKPSWLAIDFYTSLLYWGDSRATKISRINLKTGKTSVVVNHLNSKLFAIDIFENWIYYTDWLNNRIMKFNLMTGHESPLLSTPKPMGLKIMHPVAQPSFNIKSSCANHDCQYMCIPSSYVVTNMYNSNSTHCVCPETSIWNSRYKNCSDPTEQNIHQWIQIQKTVIPEPKPKRVVNASKALASTAHKVAGPVLSFVFIVLILCVVVGILIYRNYVRKVIESSTNFSNPSYLRRTATSEIEMVSNELQKPIQPPYNDYPPSEEVQFGVGEALISNHNGDPEVYDSMPA